MRGIAAHTDSWNLPAAPGSTRAPQVDSGRHAGARMRYFGVSLGHATHSEAEQWLRDLGVPANAEAYTHLVDLPYPHIAVSLAVRSGTALTLPSGPVELSAAAAHAARAHAARRAGRAVYFRGVTALTGTVAVARVLAETAIDRVVVRDDGVARPADLIVDAERIRPQWTDGLLTLSTLRRAGGRLTVFDHDARPAR